MRQKHSHLRSVALSFRSILFILLVGGINSTFAVFVSRFVSWDDLSKKSPDIVIVRCTATPEPVAVSDFMIWSDIEVLSVLKGDTKPGKARMVGMHWPHQGERFMIFSTYDSNKTYQVYNATEWYKFVPLGSSFTTKVLAGKSLEEQIQIVLRHRLEELNEELKKGAIEKQRLEEGIKK